MLTSPEETIEINMPASIPPRVSMAKDLPGTDLFTKTDSSTSLIKVYPDAIQMGAVITRVKISDLKKDIVSPGCTKEVEATSRNKSETIGEKENNRLMLLRLVVLVSPPSQAPKADIISHVPIKTPAISSLPPAMFIASFMNNS